MIKFTCRTIVISALLGAIAVPATSFGAEYFVCYNAAECNAGAGSGWSTGSPSNNGLSKSSPLQCPKDLHSKLVPGTTAIIGDGTYSWSRCNGSNAIFRPIDKDGTAAQPIVVMAENKWGAVFDGEEVVRDDAVRGRKLIMFEYSSHIEIRDIELKRGKSGIEFYAGRVNSFITLKNLKMYDFTFVAISTQITDRDITIDGTLSYDIWDDSNYDQNHTCVHQHNMYLNGYNLTVTNNVLHSSNGGTALTVGGFCNIDGVEQDPAGFTHTIHAVNNTFDGNGCVATYTEPGGDRRFSTIDFYNRTLHSGDYCSNITGGAKKRNFKNVAFENNLFLGGQTAIAPTGQPAHAAGYQNAETILVPPSCLDHPWRSASCQTATLGSAGYLIYKNNVAETYTQNPTYQGWTSEYANNCDQCSGINVTNKTQHDYRPTANSTALIGKGSAQNAPSYDFLGRIRPAGSVDVGAYQFSTDVTGGPGPTPNPPTFADSGPQ